MSSFELDNANYLHNTTDGWEMSNKPLTEEQVQRFKDGTMTRKECWTLVLNEVKE